MPAFSRCTISATRASIERYSGSSRLACSWVAAAILPSRTRLAMSATITIASSWPARTFWMTTRSGSSTAASSCASASLKRLFSRSTEATAASSRTSSAIAVRCICMASEWWISCARSRRWCARSRSSLWRDISRIVNRLKAPMAMKSSADVISIVSDTAIP